MKTRQTIPIREEVRMKSVALRKGQTTTADKKPSKDKKCC
jgi:hypothetical protein